MPRKKIRKALKLVFKETYGVRNRMLYWRAGMESWFYRNIPVLADVSCVINPLKYSNNQRVFSEQSIHQDDDGRIAWNRSTLYPMVDCLHSSLFACIDDEERAFGKICKKPGASLRPDHRSLH
jgi:hypothetical protein